MDYRTVFDITNAGFKSWRFPAAGLIGVVIGVLLFFLRRHLPGSWGQNPRSRSVVALLILGFSVIWTTTVFFTTYSEYLSLRHAIDRGQVNVVEGVVSQFIPMPVTGHARERFCVREQCFEYSDYHITAGFNNTTSHGGPIQEGLNVRLAFIGNDIVKLEIERNR